MAGSGASLEISSRTSVGQSGRDLAEGLGGMGALGDDETPRRRNAVGLEIAGPLLWAFTGRDHGVGHHCGHAGTAEDATG